MPDIEQDESCVNLCVMPVAIDHAQPDDGGEGYPVRDNTSQCKCNAYQQCKTDSKDDIITEHIINDGNTNNSI